MIPLMLTLLGMAAIAGGGALLIRATAYRRRPWSDRMTRRMAWAAFTWTVITAVVLVLTPTVSSSSVSVSSSGSTSSTTSTGTLLEHEGAGVIAVLLVPVVVALAGAPGRGLEARRRRITAGWVLAGFCLLGAASLGIFYIPAAVALLVAGLKSPRNRQHDERGHESPSLNPAR